VFDDAPSAISGQALRNGCLQPTIELCEYLTIDLFLCQGKTPSTENYSAIHYTFVPKGLTQIASHAPSGAIKIDARPDAGTQRNEEDDMEEKGLSDLLTLPSPHPSVSASLREPRYSRGVAGTLESHLDGPMKKVGNSGDYCLAFAREVQWSRVGRENQ